MAESVVKHLVQKLTSSVVAEVSLQNNVEKELADIKDEFVSMQALLRDADAKEDGKGNESLKVWVKQVRDVAYETENVIDEFMLPHHYQQQDSTGCYCYEFIAHFLKALWKRHQLANQIQDINRRVHEIARRKETYGLSKWEQGSTSNAAQVTPQRDPREDALFLEEAQIVGIDQSKATLIEWLVNNEQNSSLGIVSVYGEGGLGKTTLVKKVFDSQTVIAHFPCRAWITVSQTYSIATLLHDLIKKLLNEELATMNVTQLKETLRDGLRGKRYIVVLDDIWTLEAWEDFNNAFPDDRCGSRIMTTTRFHNIAKDCIFENHGLAFPLPYLLLEDAMKLFCKKAFASYDVNSCPPNLREIAQNFLRKCNGLPLAVVSVAGLLRNKNHREWVQVSENLGSLIGSDEKLKKLNLIISMSFNDLSYHLKSCFLYLSIFPEDYSIPCSRLVRLWSAEGFSDGNLGLSSSTTKEDIGRGYLDELLDRSLVLAEEFGVTGRVRSCKVHDVMRDFIVRKAHEQAFVSHVDRDGLKGQMVGRRLSILDGRNSQNVLSEEVTLLSHLWSLIAFEEGFVLWSSLKLLRVLDLGDIRVNGFPSEIVNLFNLRYLRLEGEMEYVPISIGKLRNLEVLIIPMGFTEYPLPKEIFELNRLRYISGTCLKFPVEIDRLANLESLSRIYVDIEESGEMVERLGRLTQMRKLSIEMLKKEDGMQLCASIEKMEYLRFLRVATPLTSSVKLEMQNLRSPPPHLQKLRLEGCLHTCPSWFPKLENLIKLSLWNSKIKDDSLLKSIQRLPSLVELNLWWDAFSGKELYFEERGFPRLGQLRLWSLNKLKMVKVEQGAMPRIQMIEFEYCPKLEKAPVGIEHLTTLKTIKVEGMARNFEYEIKRQIWKAGHAPLVRIRAGH